MSKIAEFYSGKTVLITGATGFLGKVLLEKILRCIPDVKRIYLLLRPKKGISLETRLKNLISDKPFTFNTIPSCQFAKVVPIHADLSQETMGVADEDLERIKNEVSVVIHMAASIRFDLKLKDALIQNTLATKILLDWCTEMKNLTSVVHVSTTYCNFEQIKGDEKIYDLAGRDPYQILDLLHWMDEDTLNSIEKALISPHPNSYTFTKRLAELLIRDMGKKLPLAIVRPSIVGPAYVEPTDGWMDNLNGPIGLCIAVDLGLSREMFCNGDACPDIIPVDYVINEIIAASWFRANHKSNDVIVLNSTVREEHKRPWNFIGDQCYMACDVYEFVPQLWYRKKPILTKNIYYYYVIIIFCHFLPGYIMDGLLYIFQQKPFLINIYKKLHQAQMMFGHFSTKTFKFDTSNSTKMFQHLCPEDQKIYYSISEGYSWETYSQISYIGSRIYIRKNKPCSNPKLLKYSLFALDKFCQTILGYGLLWTILYFLGKTRILTLSYWMNSY